eukprot:6490606-Amphidinium_carterae.2
MSALDVVAARNCIIAASSCSGESSISSRHSGSHARVVTLLFFCSAKQIRSVLLHMTVMSDLRLLVCHPRVPAIFGSLAVVSLTNQLHEIYNQPCEWPVLPQYYVTMFANHVLVLAVLDTFVFAFALCTVLTLTLSADTV